MKGTDMSSLDRAVEIFKATYNEDNIHWYFTYERDLLKVHELLENLEQQLTPHGDYCPDDPCDIKYIYRDAIVKKLMEALANSSINQGRVLYYTAILVYLRRYHAISDNMLRTTYYKEDDASKKGL